MQLPTCEFCGKPLEDHYCREQIFLEDVDKRVEVITGFASCEESLEVFNSGLRHEIDQGPVRRSSDT